MSQKFNYENLHWQYSTKEYTLFREEEIILKVKLNPAGTKASFDFDGEEYIVYVEGFWTPIVKVRTGDKEILQMKKSLWGNTSMIQFEGGGNYQTKIINAHLVKMVFNDESKREIFNFHLIAESRKTKVVMNVFPNECPRNEFVFLLVLGAYCFKAMVAENTTDLIVMIAAGA